MSHYVSSFLSTLIPYVPYAAPSSSSSDAELAESSSSVPSEAYIDRSPLSRVPTAESCCTDKQAKITNKRYKNKNSLFCATKGIKVAQEPGPLQAQKANLLPDEACSYYVMKVRMKKGWKLTFKGTYPHERYFSYTLGNQLGNGQVGNGTYLRGDQIWPNEGSVNPFIPGNDRNAPNRDYTIHVVHGLEPKIRDPHDNTLYTNSEEEEVRIHFSSRNYLPDDGYDGTGVVMLDEDGYGLPEYELTTPEGESFKDKDTLFALLDPQKEGDPNGYDLGQWQELVAQAHDRLNAPCLPETAAEKYFDNTWNVTGMFYKNPEERIANCPPNGKGGFANNPDTNYLMIPYSLHLPSDPGNFPSSSASCKSEASPELVSKPQLSGFGDVLVTRGMMPTHPKTRQGGNSLPVDPQVQFFSATAYGAPPSGQGYQGKCDEQMPLDANGYYTVVVGTAWNRPENTTIEDGVAYLDSGHGEGFFSGARPGIGCVGLRYMAASENWAESPANVPMPTAQEPVDQSPYIMKQYYPRSIYMSREEFEKINWKAITLEEWDQLCAVSVSKIRSRFKGKEEE